MSFICLCLKFTRWENHNPLQQFHLMPQAHINGYFFLFFVQSLDLVSEGFRLRRPYEAQFVVFLNLSQKMDMQAVPSPNGSYSLYPFISGAEQFILSMEAALESFWYLCLTVCHICSVFVHSPGTDRTLWDIMYCIIYQ